MPVFQHSSEVLPRCVDTSTPASDRVVTVLTCFDNVQCSDIINQEKYLKITHPTDICDNNKMNKLYDYSDEAPDKTKDCASPLADSLSFQKIIVSEKSEIISNDNCNIVIELDKQSSVDDVEPPLDIGSDFGIDLRSIEADSIRQCSTEELGIQDILERCVRIYHIKDQDVGGGAFLGVEETSPVTDYTPLVENDDDSLLTNDDNLLDNMGDITQLCNLFNVQENVEHIKREDSFNESLLCDVPLDLGLGDNRRSVIVVSEHNYCNMGERKRKWQNKRRKPCPAHKQVYPVQHSFITVDVTSSDVPEVDDTNQSARILMTENSSDMEPMESAATDGAPITEGGDCQTLKSFAEPTPSQPMITPSNLNNNNNSPDLSVEESNQYSSNESTSIEDHQLFGEVMTNDDHHSRVRQQTSIRCDHQANTDLNFTLDTPLLHCGGEENEGTFQLVCSAVNAGELEITETFPTSPDNQVSESRENYYVCRAKPH